MFAKKSVICTALLAILFSSTLWSADRVVFFVHVPHHHQSWYDMACLAAQAAAMRVTDGMPVVLTLRDPDAIPFEMEDYLKRYKPDRGYSIGCYLKARKDFRIEAIDPISADEAACELAETHFGKAPRVVMAHEGNYASALMGATVACRLKVPLMFCTNRGMTRRCRRMLTQLKTTEAILVGLPETTAEAVTNDGLRVVRLTDADAAISWMERNDMPVDYLAVVNPRDRLDVSKTVKKKLSLAAPLLAAVRGGMVIPIPYDVIWKRGFLADAKTRNGTITLTKDSKFAFRIEGKQHRTTCFIDRNANGEFIDEGEGPLPRAGTVTLGDKTWAYAVGKSCGPGLKEKEKTPDLWLTWPTAEEVAGKVRKYAVTTKGHRKYLLLTGYQDALPSFMVTNTTPFDFGDLLSDFPYGNVDEDPYAELCVGRFIADNVDYAMLLASRTITYPLLLDKAWTTNFGLSQWRTGEDPFFEAAGFKTVRHHKHKLIRDGEPITNVSGISHVAHSGWYHMGEFYTWGLKVPLAPMVIETNGCFVAGLDREKGWRSVNAVVLRNGAIAVTANTRLGVGHAWGLSHEFWYQAFRGKSIGEASRLSLNNMAHALHTGKGLCGGYVRYSMYIRMLLGDPAFVIHSPSIKRKDSPATHTVNDDIVTVWAPGKWSLTERVYPRQDWQKMPYWKDRFHAYSATGAGCYQIPRSGPGPRKLGYMVRLRTPKKVKSISQLGDVPGELRWNKAFSVDEDLNSDNRTYYWLVPLLAYEMGEEEIQEKLASARFKIDYE